MITTQNLTINLADRTIISPSDINIPTGSFVYLLGANGAGKSTFVKALLQLIPFAGEIKINNAPASPRLIGELVGYVPQYAMLERSFPITVKEVIELECGPACNHGVGKHLEVLGVEGLLKKRIGDLSGGELQKVLIARSLVSNPEIIIFDEPYNNLDSASQQELEKLMRDLNSQGKTIILVTHGHEHIEETDLVFTITNGNISKLSGAERENYLHSSRH